MKKRILIFAAAIVFATGLTGVALYAGVDPTQPNGYGTCSNEEGECIAICPGENCGIMFYTPWDRGGIGTITKGKCPECGHVFGPTD